jgi:transcriptional regulator with XRE-family HTH domain
MPFSWGNGQSSEPLASGFLFWLDGRRSFSVEESTMVSNLKVALTARRIRQAELATAIGVAPSTLSEFIHGRVELAPHQRQRIAEMLRADPRVAVRACDSHSGAEIGHRAEPEWDFRSGQRCTRSIGSSPALPRCQNCEYCLRHSSDNSNRALYLISLGGVLSADCGAAPPRKNASNTRR